ncbi:histidine kinase [Mucilaginibacter sp. SMC90]|uniref:ligand-binding sensor domain-containing protein n=1 Tax=Mucilaginibacter sp. SMC90 TaxID=2929803 RepID=UPI001FB45CDC|nr:sensor histidine kinase [Mucilaginibacter sp. SMC90]UOE46234.1 histidine kinase [Mucilaginibacter sp. SMC90]
MLLSCAFAQTKIQLKFQAYSIDDGLSQGFVSSIIQDQTGLMWFATGDGLNKYDGYKFTIYHHDAKDSASIASDDLTALLEDSRGWMWVGTRHDGLDLFDRENNSFYHFRYSSGNRLRSDEVLGLSEDYTGNIWIRTRYGIDRLTIHKRLRHEPTGPPLSLNDYAMVFTHINLDNNADREKKKKDYGAENLFVDSHGRVLITSHNTVWELIDDTSVKSSYILKIRFKFLPMEPNFVPALTEDTISHNLLLNYKKIVRFPYGDFSKPDYVYAYNPKQISWVTDNKNNLWISEGDGLTTINLLTGTLKYISSDEPLQNKGLQGTTTFYKDRSGVIWIATGGYGILKYDPEIELFHHLLPGVNHYQLIGDNPDKIFTNNFDSIQIKANGTVAITRFIDASTLKKHFPKFGVISLAKDAFGNFWTGINGAIVRYNKTTKSVRKFYLPFNENVTQPYPLYADPQNNIWMGYNKYFVKFEPSSGKFTRFSYSIGPKLYDYDFLQNIYQDEKLLWLGSTNGLFCFNTATNQIIKHYSHELTDTLSLSNNFMLSLANDPFQPHRYLWVGTKGGGLNKLDKATGKFLHYDTKDGLANNVIYGILSDNNGDLWLSTNRGLSRLNITNGKVRNFDVSDGLQGNEFNRYAYCRISGGLLAFGGLNGINYFDPNDIETLPPPKVIITDLKVFNESVRPGKNNSILKKSIGYSKSITLQYEQNVLTLQFAAMDYRNPDNIRYRYMMKGFDKDYLYIKNQHEVTYTNLDPGSYTFTVQADFEDGIWGDDYTNLEIVIIPPWYMTWWFYSLSAAMSISSTYAFYRYRLYQLTKLERLRNRIARDLHDEVGSSISTIAIYSKIVQQQMNNAQLENEPLVNKITESATEIMESMSDIVWNIHTKNDAFDSIISRMREHAYQIFEAKGYILHFEFDESLNKRRLPMEKRRDLYLIYKEALNNIAKYAQGKNVWIMLFSANNMISLVIKDDGKGFDITHVKKSSNGLANMDHRATSLKGKIKITSRPGHGTEIYLTF